MSAPWHGKSRRLGTLPAWTSFVVGKRSNLLKAWMITGPPQIAGIDLSWSFLTLVGEESPATPQKVSASKASFPPEWEQEKAVIPPPAEVPSGEPAVVFCGMHVS